MRKFLLFALLFFLFAMPFLNPVNAIVDPLVVPNNKFGIHIIQGTPDESSPSASLVNSSGGDWGYVTFLIESKDRDESKWQEFFNDLRRRHLIPIVRLATKPFNDYWERPYEGDQQAWADFLNSLNWPVKNRYVIVYNEPNHAKEWGNKVDAKSYAKVLDQTITALKNKNRDFFVLNAGFDASAPSKPPFFEDQLIYMQQMEETVPGIFNKLDGWSSHSYPNPDFAGSPDGTGRGSIRTWYWELQQLRALGVTKNLPIFITETGWKHAEGLNYDYRLPNQETVAGYFQKAFENSWVNERIVAVTPFLLSYQQTPFDHFSFKNTNSDYYAMYQTIQNLPKVGGKPIQQISAELTKGEVYSSIVAGEIYNISLNFKNTGQSIWNDGMQVKLAPLLGGEDLGINAVELPKNTKIEPGQDYNFNIQLRAPQKGTFKVVLNLFSGNTQFESNPTEFITEVKQPVILQILSSLKWKKTAQGEYILKVSGVAGDSTRKITLDSNGKSQELEARYLLPDYAFDFTLEKTNYHPMTIHQTVKSGLNVLDFRILQPALLEALLHPEQFWQLLPFSN
ncbi:cellulase family glycosylhydrolase [Candidatus Daviesbacteria bacterium]|nr:cellulase family glycosylhydrolase [Candidatus Daviesbacteria bacterium]